MASLPEIQSLVEQIKNDLPLLVQRSQITPQQVVVGEGLSDISKRLGLVMAGEFRAGNGIEPGLGFSGVRLGYPAFVYENDTWNFVGINDDVLQVGVSADDGKLYFGAGTGILDVEGIKIVAEGAFLDDNGYKFVDENGNIIGGLYAIARTVEQDVYVRLRAQDQVADYVNATASVDGAAGTTAIARLTVDSGGYTGAAGMLILQQTTTATSLFTQDVHTIDLQALTGVVINDDGANADFRVESDTHASALALDADLELFQIFGTDIAQFDYLNEQIRLFNSIIVMTPTVAGFYGIVNFDLNDERMEIGFDHYFPTRDALNPNGFWNEANQDMDFTFEGVGGINLISDAGLNAIGIGDVAESGYALKVTGQAKITGYVDAAVKALYGDWSNWATYRDRSVANMLGWRAYGNSHTIVDVSPGTTPDGVAHSNTDSEAAWTASYPTLVGWNGTSTYGLRVDRARLSDTSNLAYALQTATVYHSIAQSIAHNTWTVVGFNTDLNDVWSWHDPANSPYMWIPTGEGQVILQNFAFASNATGLRGIRVRDTLGNTWGSHMVAALSGADTPLPLVVQRATIGNQPVYIEVYQSSGAALNLQAFPKFTANRIG
jgi:hypothetical protein